MQKNELEKFAGLSKSLCAEINKAFLGHPDRLQQVITGLFAGLHVLLDDIPGVGKTTLAHALARASGLDFGRIQFTPDLLPGDILGMTVWSPEKRDFVFKEGLLGHHFLLADEINRASPRTQAALLEAMQESTLTVDGVTRKLPDPFFVFATQNPLQFAGTFALPEAQMDRFGLCLSLGYPSSAQARAILKLQNQAAPLESLVPVTSAEEILRLRELSRQVRVHDQVQDYLITLTEKTRHHPDIALGLSPRFMVHALKAVQVLALLRGRDYVSPEEIKELFVPMAAHRLVLSGEARMKQKSSARILESLLNEVPLPTGVE